MSDAQKKDPDRGRHHCRVSTSEVSSRNSYPAERPWMVSKATTHTLHRKPLPYRLLRQSHLALDWDSGRLHRSRKGEAHFRELHWVERRVKTASSWSLYHQQHAKNASKKGPPRQHREPKKVSPGVLNIAVLRPPIWQFSKNISPAVQPEAASLQVYFPHQHRRNAPQGHKNAQFQFDCHPSIIHSLPIEYLTF
jgi:hypothetical protein